MKIAIIGAGLSGLAVCWHLLQYDDIDITVFDPAGIGGGCSGIAAGLMHLYGGEHARRASDGDQGWESTCRLLRIASEELKCEVATFSGMLRPAITTTQKLDFTLTASRYVNEIEWWEADRCQQMIPGIAGYPGIYIKQSATVNCLLYLKGLWQACHHLGAQLELTAIHNLEELNEYDAVVVASGPAVVMYPELRHLRITPVKGQLLELAWPKECPKLSLPLNSDCYLAMKDDGLSCYAGSTFERGLSNPTPDLSIALSDIMPKVEEVFPPLKNAKVLDCRAGIRASSATHLPFYGNTNKRYWYLSGLSSKGLLRHAFYAEKLVANMATHLF